MKRDISLYQIAYSEQILQELEPGYLPLHNIENERPDWREYWPIRNFLLNEELDSNTFYGFFSPKFGNKTGLTYEQTRNHIDSAAEDVDVVLFSPQPDMGAFFLNVFEQGETFDQGFIDAYQGFLTSIDFQVNLRNLIMDSRHVVFSNYFVAKPEFWRAWLDINEKFFKCCEGPSSKVQKGLTKATTYPGDVPRKVFLMERVASLLLTVQPKWRTKTVDPFRFGWSGSKLREYPEEAVISDALKMAMREQGFPEYFNAFSNIRKRCFKTGT